MGNGSGDLIRKGELRGFEEQDQELAKKTALDYVERAAYEMHSTPASIGSAVSGERKRREQVAFGRIGALHNKAIGLSDLGEDALGSAAVLSRDAGVNVGRTGTWIAKEAWDIVKALPTHNPIMTGLKAVRNVATRTAPAPEAVRHDREEARQTALQNNDAYQTWHQHEPDREAVRADRHRMQEEAAERKNQAKMEDAKRKHEESRWDIRKSIKRNPKGVHDEKPARNPDSNTVLDADGLPVFERKEGIYSIKPSRDDDGKITLIDGQPVMEKQLDKTALYLRTGKLTKARPNAPPKREAPANAA